MQYGCAHTADGSMSLYPVARIENHNFTYINEETNTTLWPGLLKSLW